MAGIGPNNLNLANNLNVVMQNWMNAIAAASNNQSAPTPPVSRPVQDPTLPDLGLAGTPFNSSSSQPLTVGLLGTTVRQMDAQDAVSLGGRGRGEGAGESSGEGAGEGTGNAGNSGRSNRRSRAGE
jgi:hypothetical protein